MNDTFISIIMVNMKFDSDSWSCLKDDIEQERQSMVESWHTKWALVILCSSETYYSNWNMSWVYIFMQHYLKHFHAYPGKITILLYTFIETVKTN